MEDTVAEWVRIARRDAKLARVALDAGDPENALYLCQQALEKALKAHIQAKEDQRSSAGDPQSPASGQHGWVLGSAL